ncbi:hypothetical protein CSHISOI_08083 [Colletotrichum shisoi]|uniref:Uncharacterized protein n=1 Tax=Colletotrichum shisoi TaxID=2078593 RepID=A0A5Q4BLE5_9PEZI|nr:hypothetical protein CSHISOI_08083 [Colletotrichum shisoi]
MAVQQDTIPALDHWLQRHSRRHHMRRPALAARTKRVTQALRQHTQHSAGDHVQDLAPRRRTRHWGGFMEFSSSGRSLAFHQLGTAGYRIIGK